MTGETEASAAWCGQRWMKYLLEEVLGGPPADSLLRGVRKAQVQVSVARGRVTAQVRTGSDHRAYTAGVKVKPLSEREWRLGLGALAEHPLIAHRLLAGEVGPELEAIWREAGVRLFPDAADAYPLLCSCRNPDCRHLYALALHSAERFSASPLLWLEVRGRSRADLLSALRARLADQGGALRGEAEQPSGLELDLATYWRTETDPASISVRPGSAVAPDAVLRLLGPLPLPAEKKALDDPHRAEEVLSAYVKGIGRAATELATGERRKEYIQAALPGKAVRAADRLVDEVAEALARAGALVSMEQLRADTPTAKALPEEQAEKALTAALGALGEEIALLPGRLVGRREALLGDASFHHLITFDEWRFGALSPDADWVRVLGMAGLGLPYRLQAGSQICTVMEPDEGNRRPGRPDSLFAALRPEVGDQLHLQVIDPAGGRLGVSLIRREERSFGTPPGNNAALAALLGHMTAAGQQRLSETEALTVLLRAGLFRYGAAAHDPVWLLPLEGEALGLYSEGAHRVLTTNRWGMWRPSFKGAGDWPGREEEVQAFTAGLTDQGMPPREAEAVGLSVQAWCRHCAGDQRLASQVPPVRVVLDFLWNVAPQESLAVDLKPEGLARWFAFLQERHFQVRKAYGDHIAACGLAEHYRHRVRTCPGSRAAGEALLAWKAEAYRWMGPGQYLGTVGRAGIFPGTV